MDSIIQEIRKEATKNCWIDQKDGVLKEMGCTKRSELESTIEGIDHHNEYDNVIFYQGFFCALRRIEQALLEATGENHN